MGNVLIMAMSVLNGTYVTNYRAQQEDADFKCQGVSQLEPIPKYMQYRLGTVDHILVLCTEETLAKRKPKNEVYTEEDTMSAYDFFCNRIIKDEEFDLKNTVIESVEIDENRPEKGIIEMISKVRNIKDTEGISTLWIDTHGGFREISLVSSSLVQLLDNYEIHVDALYGTHHDPLDRNKPTEIVNQTRSYRIVDFVSGMSEFVNYGGVTGFNNYYSESSNEDQQTGKVLEAMKTVSNGIGICDPKLYVEGLKKLNKALSKYNEDQSYLGIFKQYFQKDYGDLLGDRITGTDRILTIIDRCADRGMLQQALTFLEASMPLELYKKGFLAPESLQVKPYGGNVRILDENSGFENRSAWLDENKVRNTANVRDLFSKIKPYEKEDLRIAYINYFINENGKGGAYEAHYFKIGELIQIPFETDEVAEWIEKAAKILQNRGGLLQLLPTPRLDLSVDTNTAACTLQYKIQTSGDWNEDQRSYLISLFFSLHKGLKEQRNNYNHAENTGARQDANQIKRLLKAYVKVGRILGLD